MECSPNARFLPVFPKYVRVEKGAQRCLALWSLIRVAQKIFALVGRVASLYVLEYVTQPMTAAPVAQAAKRSPRWKVSTFVSRILDFRV